MAGKTGQIYTRTRAHVREKLNDNKTEGKHFYKSTKH